MSDIKGLRSPRVDHVILPHPRGPPAAKRRASVETNRLCRAAAPGRRLRRMFCLRTIVTRN